MLVSTGEAEATVAIANAKAEALQKVGESLRTSGGDAASLSVAEQYVKAFSELAKTNNTLILPADTANVSSTVAQVRTFPHDSRAYPVSPYRRCKCTRPCQREKRVVRKADTENESKELNSAERVTGCVSERTL